MQFGASSRLPEPKLSKLQNCELSPVMSAVRAADHPVAISHTGSLSLLDVRRRLRELAVGIFS
jgi:hypothetical protein